MPCAGAAYITEIILGVMNRCVVERGCAALGKVELAERLVAKAASVGMLTFSALSLCTEAFK